MSAINSDLNSKILNISKWIPVPGAVALIGVAILLAVPAIPALVIGLKVVVITAGAVAAIMALLLLGVAFYKLFSLACEFIDEKQKAAEVVNKHLEKRIDATQTQINRITAEINANIKIIKAQNLEMMKSLVTFEKAEIAEIVDKMRAQNATIVVGNEGYDTALLRLERSLINEYLNAHRMFDPKVIDERRAQPNYNETKEKGFFLRIEGETESSLNAIVEALFIDCFFLKDGEFTVNRLRAIKDKLMAEHKFPKDFIYFNVDKNSNISVPDQLRIIPKIDVLLSVIRWKQTDGFKP